MYRIDYDRQAGIVRVSVEGFWDVATAERFGADLRRPMNEAKTSGRPVLVLSDARKFVVQPPEVAAIFARIEEEQGPLRDRLAMVVTSILAKMQGERAVAGSTARFFATPEEAEAWLLDPEPKE
jgi:hypothetical protein